jgi:hypothetical protein
MMSPSLYVRRRNESGKYELLDLIDGMVPLDGETVYYDCRICKRRVVAGFGKEALRAVHRDARGGCCFQHIPRGARLNAEPRTDITIY